MDSDKVTIDIAEHDAIVRALEAKVAAWKEFADATAAFNRAMGIRFPVPNHIVDRYADARTRLKDLGEAPP